MWKYASFFARIRSEKTRNCDCSFITHHTVAANLTGPNFLSRKEKIVAALDNTIRHGDMDRMATIRQNKRTL